MNEQKSKVNISAASARLASRVYVHATSPKDVPTCGFVMTPEEAIALAIRILVVAQAENAKGIIHITGRPEEKSVTVIRRIK